MFPVAKSALTHLDPYILTAVRYGVTAPVMLAILWRLEGVPRFDRTAARCNCCCSVRPASRASACWRCPACAPRRRPTAPFSSP